MPLTGPIGGIRRSPSVPHGSGDDDGDGEDAGRIVGFACVGPARDDDPDRAGAELQVLYVLPEWWRRGVGAPLLARCGDELRRWDERAATLWVLADNLDAQRFYDRHGWRPDGGERHDRDQPRVRPRVRYRREW